MSHGVRSDELLSMIESAAEAFLGDRHSLDRVRHPAPSLWSEIVDLGLAAAILPEADGGADIGAEGAVRLARLCGSALLPEPFVEHALVPAALATALPDIPARQSLVAALTGGPRTASLAWQEALDGLAPWRGACRYRQGRLFGGKTLSPLADQIFVTAVADDGPVLAVLAAGETPDRPEDGTDLLGGRVSSLQFSPSGNFAERLAHGQAATQAVERALDMGALATSALLLGGADRLLEMTLAHLRTRRQFGKPLGAFQALQHRVTDIFMAQAETEATLQDAARLYDLAPDSDAARAAISAAKAKACDLAALTMREAIQMHGAIGFTEEADVGLFVRAMIVWSPRFGGALVHRRRFLDLEGDRHD